MKFPELMSECVRYYHELQHGNNGCWTRLRMKQKAAFTFGITVETLDWMLAHAYVAGRASDGHRS
jgi:hypothetical protein